MGYVGKIKDTGGTTHLVGSTLYGTCSTGASTAAKVVTLSDITADADLVTGLTIHVKFSNSNTASNATLKVGGSSAKNLCRYGTTRVGTVDRESWWAGAVVSFTYDGTSWVMNDYIPDAGDTKVEQVGSNGNYDYPLLLKYTDGTSNVTNPARYGNVSGKLMTANPSTGNIQATSFNDINMGYDNETQHMFFETSSCSLEIDDGDYFLLGSACAKGVDTSISAGSTSTKLPTTAAVVSYVANQISGQSKFMGTVGTSGATYTEAQLEALAYKAGMYFVCSSSGEFVGETCEAGDMIWCVKDKTGTTYSASDFSVVQENIDTISNNDIDTIMAA